MSDHKVYKEREVYMQVYSMLYPHGKGSYKSVAVIRASSPAQARTILRAEYPWLVNAHIGTSREGESHFGYEPEILLCTLDVLES